METKTAPSMWKRIARATLCVAAGSLILVGCASSGLSEDEEKVVGSWYDKATVLKAAQDPDLRASSKTGIGTLDVIADVVMPISGSVARLTDGYIRRSYASVSWNAYAHWVNGPDGGKLSEAEFNAQKPIQAKMAVYEQGMALAGGDILNSAKKVYKFRKIKPTDTGSLNSFFAEAEGSSNLTKWSNALIAANGKDRDAFYDAVIPDLPKADTVSFKDRVDGLKKDLAKLQKTLPLLQAALAEKDLASKIAAASFTGAEIVKGVDGKETLKLIDRLKKQLQVTLELTPWLIDALTTAD